MEQVGLEFYEYNIYTTQYSQLLALKTSKETKINNNKIPETLCTVLFVLRIRL